METPAKSQCGKKFEEVLIGSKMKELVDFDQYLNDSSFPPKCSQFSALESIEKGSWISAKWSILKGAQKVPTLLKVPIIVPKRVPFSQKSSQYSALKSVPKKFKKKNAK